MMFGIVVNVKTIVALVSIAAFLGFLFGFYVGLNIVRNGRRK